MESDEVSAFAEERWKEEVRKARDAWLAAEAEVVRLEGHQVAQYAAGQWAAELHTKLLRLESGEGFDWPESHRPGGP